MKVSHNIVLLSSLGFTEEEEGEGKSGKKEDCKQEEGIREDVEGC